MDRALIELRDAVSEGVATEDLITRKCSENRVRRVELYNGLLKSLVIVTFFMFDGVTNRRYCRLERL